MSRCSDLHSSNMQQPTFRTFISDIFVKLKVLVQLKFNVLCLYFCICTSLVLHCLACIERVCRGTENHYSCFRPGRRNAELGQGPLLVLMDDGDGKPRPDTVSPFLEGIILSVRNINVSKYFTQQFGFQNRNIKEWCIEIATMCSISPYHHELSVSYGPTTLHRWSVLWYFIPVTVCR